MHPTSIPPAAREINRRRRGETAPIALIPGRFAHVAIDLQNGFMADGAIPIAANHAILPNVNRLSAAVRGAGGVNIFVRFTYDPAWTSYYGRFAPGREDVMKAAFTEDSWEHRIFAEVDVRGDDLTLNKTRFSCLTPGTCDLDAVLQARGIDTLVVTGCTSNCCCESTARDALQMNYSVVFVQDANAAMSDADHNGAVADLFGIFGCDICTTDEVVRRMTPP